MVDKYQEIWESFIAKVLSRDYDKASEMWDPETRNIFRKNIKSFRKKHHRWKTVEYVKTTDDGYIIIRYFHPKGLTARSVLAFNQFRAGKVKKYGRLISLFYQFLKKVRGNGSGYFNSFCGVLLKHFDVAAREFCCEEVVKKYALLHDKDLCFLGWSYTKSIIPEKICYQYAFDTFLFWSAVDYSLHMPMLAKLDKYIKNVLKDIDLDIPKINIYFHARLNSPRTGIPKSIFVVPGRNDICIYHIRIKYDTLRHEMLHAIIYAATSSWPPLFFREGYAESYDHNLNYAPIIQQKFLLGFLLHDSLFFDYSESPPVIAGCLVRYLISQYGIKKFYMAYQKAEFTSTKYVLKNIYGLSIKQLKKRAIREYRRETTFKEK